MNKEVNNYIEIFIENSNPVISRISEKYSERTDVSPCIGPQGARFIQWLIIITNSKNIVEFGTCTGYSTIILAEAAKQTGGKVTAIEIAKNHFAETAFNIKEANLEEYVNLIKGNAKTEFEKLDGPFDFILQDSLKSLYPEMLNSCIEKLKPGGIIAADDTLFQPLGFKEKFSSYMHKYNELVFSDSRLYSTILPLGDGLTISYKKIIFK